MRILFALTQYALVRHFESVVLELARRGHQVKIVTQDRGEGIKLPAAFEREPNISHELNELTRGDAHGELLRKTRAIRDYLRYLAPAFANADKLRTRALRKMIKTVSDDKQSHLSARAPDGKKVKDEGLIAMLVEAIDGGEPHGPALDRFLAQIEAAVPADAELTTYLQNEKFDAVIVTPLVFMPSPQPELVKAARAAGIPSIFPVFSWDNLTTKGLLHVIPDAVTVWNDRQRRELVELHGVPAERVIVTGAARFDGFIERNASEDRAAYCARHRLDPAQPITATRNRAARRHTTDPN
jgi:hypothetical protein